MHRLLLRFALAPLLLAVGCSSDPAPVGTRADQFTGEQIADLDPALNAFSPDALNFLIVGDWGRNGFFNQRNVGRAMGVTAEAIASQFTISTGDNFYTEGVQTIEDPKWERSYEDIYDAPSLMTRWYAVLGNHDWQGDYTAQIDYTEASDRWYLPARYYTEILALDDTTEALFVYLDTTPLSERTPKPRKYERTEDWDPDRQLEWLDATLAASDADWKIVVGHHPIYVGSVRYEDNPRLIADLVPIFERHGVNVYFCGHDHNLQHLRPEGSPVDYLISGAGSLTRGVVQTPNTLFALQVSGYMAASLTPEAMYVHALEEDGRLVYATNIPRRRLNTRTQADIQRETDMSDPENRRDLEAATTDDGEG
ncbi:MAG: tartrate-resistant acid phosphatase type 5 family protein [Bacteroidota bacterium]